jgi:hypothetical protein
MTTRLYLLAALLAAPALARAGDVTFEKGWIRAAPPGATVLAGYGIFRNAARDERSVVSATTPGFARVEFHATLPDGDVMRMRQVLAVPVPARGVTVLDPGGLHLMLIEPTAEHRAGDAVSITFTLSDGSTCDGQLEVRAEAPD